VGLPARVKPESGRTKQNCCEVIEVGIILCAMETEAFKQLKALAEGHGLTQVPGQKLGCVRFEKPGLSVETCNYLDFTVVHGSTQKECPDLAEVADYLDIIEES
jgi:hypothetical protein